MSNSSSAGDSLGLSVGRNPATGSSSGVSGWLDIKHWCAKTDTIVDYSGPNCIFEHGIEKMLKAFTVDSTASGTSFNTVKAGFWVSATATTLGRGTNPVTSTYDSLACAAAIGTTNTFFPGTGTSVNLSSGTNMGSTKGVWFATGDNDVFSSASTGTLPITQIQSDAIVLTSDGTQTINSIFLVNESVTGNPSRAQIFLLAGRTSATGAVPASEDMDQIVMADTDTLTITYTISITVS